MGVNEIKPLKSIAFTLTLTFIAVCTIVSVSEGDRLNVPLVKQSKGRLCAPASIEMVFRFWGEERYDQYAIARQIAREYSNEKRFKFSSYVVNGMSSPKDYPGTPAYILRRFLNSRATSEKFSLKNLPSDPSTLEMEFTNVLNWTKGFIDEGIPVIVHQYWKSKKSTGHYRVVTGYNEEKEKIYLNDPKVGKITQTYNEYKLKGLFKGKWMPFYSIVFNTEKDYVPF
ncbi:MAG: hypothetical protein GY795_45695 [Desulfobacterales bacterium]|nr:hypothetical protein [Desulfobacterales bacterium]